MLLPFVSVNKWTQPVLYEGQEKQMRTSRVWMISTGERADHRKEIWSTPRLAEALVVHSNP